MEQGVAIINNSTRESNRRLLLIKGLVVNLLRDLDKYLQPGSRSKKLIADKIVDTLLEFEKIDYETDIEVLRDFLNNELTSLRPHHFGIERLEFLKRKVYEKIIGFERLMDNTLVRALDRVNDD